MALRIARLAVAATLSLVAAGCGDRATEEPATAPSPATVAPAVPTTDAPPGAPGAQALDRSTVAPAAAASEPPAMPDPAAVALALEPVAQGLREPVGLASPLDGSGRLFALEKAGTIRLVGDGGVGAIFLDITDRVGSGAYEQGLLGLAFHPAFADDGPGAGRFFVNYTDRAGDTVVAEYRLAAGGELGDPASERVLLTIDQPAPNHNGGHLAFGPDGYLYVGTGDGGGAFDRFGNGQNPDTLLGKMLRVDVDAGGEAPYGIPPDNPFVGEGRFREEIWAYGLRNPWRYSFDSATGDLYIADVGQNEWEEVDFQPASSRGGENYGWPILEGNHCLADGDACDAADETVRPVVEYSQSEGCSVTGGYVYRGRRLPGLFGAYVFGDFCSGTVWSAHRGADGAWVQSELLETGAAISSFGQDDAGEVYLVDMEAGTVSRLAPEG
jgi:glucose/arabinose dehydrogenase